MSGFIAILFKFLPLILQILSGIFGVSATLSYAKLDALGGAEALLSSTGATYVGGQSLVAIVTAIVAHLTATKNANRPQPVTLATVQQAVGAANIVGLIKFVARMFSLMKNDPEAWQMFQDLVTKNSSSAPADPDAALKLFLQTR